MKWFTKESRLAYGAATAFSSGEDPAYKGIMGALKASMGLCNEQSSVESLKFVFPVVILEGRLFESYLNKNGKDEINEIDEGFVVYHREIAGYHCSSVHVVTSNFLEKFCKEAKETVEEIKSLFQPDLDEMWNGFGKT